MVRGTTNPMRYNKLIEHYKKTEFCGYTESHHIIPRCVGGMDTPDNLVNLPAKAHYLAHWMLHKMYPDEPKLARAFWFMALTGKNHQRKITARMFETARKANHIASLGEGNPFYGKTHSDDAKEKMSVAKRGKSSWNKGISCSEETKSKLRVANLGSVPWNKGIQISEETKKKISESQTGSVKSDEQKQKTSNSMKEVWRKRREGISPMPNYK